MNCKKCDKKSIERAFHFANQIAKDKGYCSFACMAGDLGHAEACVALQQDL